MPARPALHLNPLAARWHRLFVGGVSLAVMLLVGGISLWFIGGHQQHDEQELRQHVQLALAEKRAMLEGDLNTISHLTTGVISYISQNQANRYELEAANINLVLAVLYRYTPHIRSIAIAPGNRIHYVYPQQGNEALLGVYYPDIKNQWPEVERAIRERRAVMTGPIKLLQGGQGLVHRTPVFMRSGEYWGVLSIVINADHLLRDARLLGDPHIEFALRDVRSPAGTTIIGTPEVFEGDHVQQIVPIAGGAWVLAARPRSGWLQPQVRHNEARLLALGLTLLVGALCAWALQSIVSRLRSQQGLRLSQFTLEHTPESILWLNRRGEVVYRNQAAHGLPPADDASEGHLYLWDVLPGISPAQWPDIWQQLKLAGSYNLLSNPVVQQRSLYLQTSFNFMIYEGEELAVSYTRDVTEQKQGEDAMRTSQRRTSEALARARRLAYIVSRTKSAVLLTDVEGRVTWGNQAFCDLSGHTLEEVMGRRPGDFLQGPRTSADTVRHMRECLTQQQGFRVEILNYRKDGVPFWLDLEVQPILTEGGQLEGFMAVQTDITARKRAAERLEEAQRIAQLGFWEYDIEDNSGLWSDETRRIYDVEAQQSVSISTLALVLHPDDLPGMESCLRRAALDEDYTLNYECRLVRRSGEVRHVRHIGRRMPADQTQRLKLFGTVQDITEQKRAEGLKNEFVSVVSHELRTPLTSIRGGLGLLQLVMEPDNERAHGLLDLCNRNCERLLLLINDLLDMEKLSYGKMEFQLEAQALRPLLLQAMQTNQTYAQRYAIEFELYDTLPDAQVRVDGHRLQQVLTNLLSNAAKFSGEDHGPNPAGRVDIVVLRHADHVRVCVQDYGVGIAPAKHDRIFQSFSQVDASDARSRGGTGLGLAISRSLIERMGGRIGFCSVPGAGSSFWFELPLVEALAET